MEDLREWILSSIDRHCGIPRSTAIHHHCVNPHPSREVSTWVICNSCNMFSLILQALTGHNYLPLQDMIVDNIHSDCCRFCGDKCKEFYHLAHKCDVLARERLESFWDLQPPDCPPHLTGLVRFNQWTALARPWEGYSKYPGSCQSLPDQSEGGLPGSTFVGPYYCHTGWGKSLTWGCSCMPVPINGTEHSPLQTNKQIH